MDRAISARVQFVALAGDVYAAGINTFIAHGNHDPVDEGWSAVPAWPTRVYIFPAHEADTVELTAPDGTRSP